MTEYVSSFLSLFLSGQSLDNMLLPCTVAAIFLSALLSYFVCVHLLTPLMHLITLKTETEWDDDLLDRHMLSAFSQLAPALLLLWLLPEVAHKSEAWSLWLGKLCRFYIVWVVVRIVCLFLQNLYMGLEKRNMLTTHNLSVLVQAGKLVAIGVGVIIGLSILFDRSPLSVLTAFGASAAILMLVFKDTIMGLVAGVQLSANGMLHKGDWIVSDKAHANGEVIDVKLTTVKVRNWDNSITTIPPYTLVSDSFHNYQNMRRVGARRVARSINIDMNTIGFLSEERLAALRSAGHLAGLGEPEEEGRTINISLFRRYLEYYLSHHPEVRVKDKDNSAIVMMVRQLQPTAQGLPLELYFFTNRTNWKRFETLQSDIFDHVYAMLPCFGLRMYQAPAGTDFAARDTWPPL